MAYVIWRVVMKKYSRVRLGLNGSSVTPTGRHVLTYDEESWQPSDDQTKSKDSLDEIARTNETRQSKTKRVKNYLKKCKNALGNRSSSNTDQSTPSESTSLSSWYIDKNFDEVVNKSEINVIEDVFEKVNVNPELGDFKNIEQIAHVVEVKDHVNSGSFTNTEESNNANLSESEIVLTTSSPLLTQLQEEAEGTVSNSNNYVNNEQKQQEKAEENVQEIKHDVASLVDRYFGDLYSNYENSRKCLVRQARDLLVCEYHGCLQRFESEYCMPAAKLLQYLKNNFASNGCNPEGWPLCLGTAGIIIHLGPLDPSVVRNRDCYICLRNRSAPSVEVSLIWRKSSEIHCHTLAEFKNPLQNLNDIMCSTLKSTMDIDLSSFEDVDGAELPELLQNLLVSVEHAIERVPLDDLPFPCPQCCQYLPVTKQEDVQETTCSCQCACRASDGVVQKKDTSMQTSPMFEFVGSIPHIDSDEEDDKESIKSGTSVKKLQEMTPKRITDIPDKLLMSGINLPGTTDVDGRPIVLCYAECVARAGLNKYEVAKVLLYYASIPTPNSVAKGFTILLLAENEDNNKVLETLDKSICLLGNIMKISRVLVWKPGENKHCEKRILTSRVQAVFLSDETSFSNYVPKNQSPASCGGSCNHDQLEWVEFFRQLEPFLASCRTVGRALLSTLSQLRSEDIPSQINRRFLNHQCRQISKAIQLECLQKLRREGPNILTNLEERSQWLSNSGDVKRSTSFAYSSYNAVDRLSKRLEQLALDRKERLKELARLRTLQDEAEELLSWIRKVGEETLNSLILSLHATGDITSVKGLEKEFEQFYFNALRQIDKASDIVDESNNIKDPKGQNLKESTNNLKIQIKSFSDRLEESRERFEDTSRCFFLLESCQDILEDDTKESDEFRKLAFKSRNDKLIQICKTSKKSERMEPVQPPDRSSGLNPKFEVATSTPIKPQNTQIRRRSVSSHAYIFHCNHHAAGEFCNCYESDTENTVSYKLKKKYIQMQNCVCYANNKDTIERKNSVTLDGIKEERESVENILEKIDRSDNECSRYDSGLSTADNSVGDDSTVYKKKLQRTCSSCQYFRESCALCSAGSSSAGSNQDQTENQQDSIIEEGSDGFVKSSSSDDIEDEHYSEERRKVPPVPANSHLHCHASTLDLPTDAFYPNMDPKTQKTLLLIMREMIQTERDYVKSLDYIIENYLPELNRHDIPQALRGQRNVVFGNVEKIYEFHSQFFLRELEQCENNPLQVGQIFLKYDKRFYLYALYNKNKPKSDSLMSEYGSIFFKSKQIELGDKMDLASYLLKPVQRMGKYALLLQQMMKACPDVPPGALERAYSEQEDLKAAEEMVRFQLRHGNDLLAMDSIRECDVNLKEQGRLLRQNEFLVWEGRSGKKSLRQVFLFEELILFSKARRFPDRKNLDLYIYKNSIKMTDIGLTAKIGEHPNKFAIWFRKRKPNDTFTLQTISEDVKKAWTEELSQLLWKQAIKNREVRMAEMSSMGIGNKPCLDIRPSADQISDRSISFAQLSRTASRFRNSIAGPATELCRSTKRPHSVISMSSVSSGSTSSGGSGGGTTTPATLMNLSCELSCDSPKPYYRSATLNSQCSMESGIIADMSLGSDECPDNLQTNSHWPLEKSNSQHSNASVKSNTTIPTQTEDIQVTTYHVPEDIPINI